MKCSKAALNYRMPLISCSKVMRQAVHEVQEWAANRGFDDSETRLPFNVAGISRVVDAWHFRWNQAQDGLGAEEAVSLK